MLGNVHCSENECIENETRSENENTGYEARSENENVDMELCLQKPCMEKPYTENATQNNIK